MSSRPPWRVRLRALDPEAASGMAVFTAVSGPTSS